MKSSCPSGFEPDMVKLVYVTLGTGAQEVLVREVSIWGFLSSLPSQDQATGWWFCGPVTGQGVRRSLNLCLGFLVCAMGSHIFTTFLWDKLFAKHMEILGWKIQYVNEVCYWHPSRVSPMLVQCRNVMSNILREWTFQMNSTPDILCGCDRS